MIAMKYDSNTTCTETNAHKSMEPKYGKTTLQGKSMYSNLLMLYCTRTKLLKALGLYQPTLGRTRAEFYSC